MPVSLVLLGMPTFGLSLAITTVSALVPLSLRSLTSSSTVIGSIIAVEGLLALALPLWLGWLSDRTRTSFGRRLPYMMIGAPLCALSLLGLAFARTITGITALVVVFYLGYFTIYPPYRALYPDLVPRRELGRSQGVQTVFRELGLLLGLGGSPLLFAFAPQAPFLTGAVVLSILFSVFVVRLRGTIRLQRTHQPRSVREMGVSFVSLLRCYPDVRRVLLANALWEFALAGLKTFVLLYIVVGIGRSPAVASGLMALIAVVALAAAPVAGHFADRFGTVRVMRVALFVFACGLLMPTLTNSFTILIPAMPLIGFGGAIAMTLPYALLAERLPSQSHGVGAGLYEFSRGVGAFAGPLVTGAVIDLARPLFVSTRGYGAMWLAVGFALLFSIPLLPKGRREEPTRSKSVG